VVQAHLGTALIATKGWAAPEVATAYRRAQALWEQVGEPAQCCWVQYGLCAWHAMRAEWQTARALMERLLTLAQRVHHPTLRMHAHLGLGGILYCLGAFATARTHVDQGLTLYEKPRQHIRYLSGYFRRLCLGERPASPDRYARRAPMAGSAKAVAVGGSGTGGERAPRMLAGGVGAGSLGGTPSASRKRRRLA